MSDETWERPREVVAEARAVLAAHDIICRICPDYEIEYSSWTGQLYVSARIEVGGNGVLSGICEHRPTAQAALTAFARRLTEVSAPLYLVTDGNTDERRHWRYSAAADRILPMESQP